MSQEKRELISIEDLFKETFDIFSKGIEPFLVIQAIVFGITFGVVILSIALIVIVLAFDFFLVALLSEYEEIMAILIMTTIVLASTIGTLIFIITIILPSIFGYASLVVATQDVNQGIKRKVKEYFELAWDRRWEIIGLFLLTWLITMIGFIFLILPGIILGFFLVFAPFILVLEKKGIVDSIAESFRLVKNNFWEILLRLVVIYFAFMVVVIFSNFIPLANIAINFLSSIFMVIYLYLLYKSVKRISN